MFCVFVAAILNFEFARGLLVRGLEPKCGNRPEPPRSSKKMTRDETEMIAFRIVH